MDSTSLLSGLAASECQEMPFARSQQRNMEEISSCTLRNGNPSSLESDTNQEETRLPSPLALLNPSIFNRTFQFFVVTSEQKSYFPIY